MLGNNAALFGVFLALAVAIARHLENRMIRGAPIFPIFHPPTSALYLHEASSEPFHGSVVREETFNKGANAVSAVVAVAHG